MKEKNMVVYFGAAGCGEAYCRNSGITPDIFVDNDSSKWGTLFNGVEVMDPAVLISLPLAQVVVTSSFLKEVYPQILRLGVNEDIIHIPSKSMWSSHVFEDEIIRVQAADKLYETMAALSDKWSLVAVGGTALGFNRSNDFILWDDDIDLFAPIQLKPALLDLLKSQGLEVEDKLDSIMRSIVFSLPLESGVKIPVSVDFFDADSKSFTDSFEDYTWEWPTKMFTQCAQVEVHGKPMNVPNPPGKYLSEVYGSTWAEPNPNFGYSDYAGNKA